MTTNGRFGLGTFSTRAGDTFAGLVVGERVADLRPALGAETTALALCDDWDHSRDRLAELAAAGDVTDHELTDLRPRPPVAPRQILWAGANYHQHVREIVYSTLRLGGDERPEAEVRAEAEQHARCDEPAEVPDDGLSQEQVPTHVLSDGPVHGRAGVRA